MFFTSPSTGYFYATNSTGFEAGTFTFDDGPVGFLGHVRFDPDTAHSNWLLFPADGSSARLSVTNAQAGSGPGFSVRRLADGVRDYHDSLRTSMPAIRWCP